jgi:flagellar basal-body rod protein FlgG
MSGAIYAAASGAQAQRVRLEVLANNLANLNTPGFKADQAVFRIDTDAEAPADTGGDLLEPGTGTDLVPLIPVATRTDFAPGPLAQTGNALDVALQGEGFFSVQTESGIRYTRNGSFTLGPEGLLTTSDGHAVLGGGGEIAIDGGVVVIDDNGGVHVDGQEVDRLRVVTFDDPSRLRKIGASLFAADAPGMVPAERENPGLRQGYLEMSNVEAVKSMTEMIEVLRGYEAYQKIIRTLDESAGQVINGVGTPT